MENIIFTLAYILLLLWGIAIVYSGLSALWEMSGIGRELSIVRHSIVHLLKRAKNIEWKKVQLSSDKKLIHN